MPSQRSIRELIQILAGTYGKIDVQTFDATVVSVNESERTCIVDSVDGNIDGLKVRLTSSIADGELDIPQIDSTVTVASSDNTSHYIVNKSWLDKKTIIVGDTEITLTDGNVIIEQGKMKITLSGGKINIKNDTKDFKTVMDAFFDAMAQATYTNGGGTTGVSNNVNSITQAKTDFNQIFN